MADSEKAEFKTALRGFGRALVGLFDSVLGFAIAVFGLIAMVVGCVVIIRWLLG